MKPMLPILLLMLFSCSSEKPVDTRKLIERDGLVRRMIPENLFNGIGIKYYNTPFSGETVKYWPSGELQGRATYKEGIFMSGTYINKDGTLAISVEKSGDTTITIDYFGPEQKRSETRTVGGTNISIERWHEDGSIREQLYDWEKEDIDNKNFYLNKRRPLVYFLKEPLNIEEKQDVLFFMHGNGGNLWDYEYHIIDEFEDHYIKVILQAPYETSLFSNRWTWFDFKFSFFEDTTFNEEQINTSCEHIIYSINEIIKKENINPNRIYVGGNSQGGIMASKIALEYPEAIDGFIAHNALLPVVYKVKEDKSVYSKIRGLVINGKYDNDINPINSKQITNTFIKLGSDIKSTELEMGHDFPKLSRDLINEWMASK